MRFLTKTPTLTATVGIILGCCCFPTGEDFETPSVEVAPVIDVDAADAGPSEAPVASAECKAWSPPSDVPAALGVDALEDSKQVETWGRKAGFNVDCYEDDYGDYKEVDCTLSSDEYEFDVSWMKFSSTQDAKWEVEDPYPGTLYHRDGKVVVEVEGTNGPCAMALLNAVVPPETSTKGYDEAKVVNAVKAQGWKLDEDGCSVEKYAGSMTIDCYLIKGQDAGNIDVSWEIDGGNRVNEDREMEDGYAYAWQEYGDASAYVYHQESSKALLKALTGL